MTTKAKEEAAHDPLESLTRAERACLHHINDTMSKGEILDSLREHLEIALTVELATIPIYLYTYYSINRKPTSNNSPMYPPAEGAVPDIPDHVGAGRAEQIQLYANEAGGVIMSVAVEEMLHMSLASNILYSLGGNPQVYMKSPGPPNPPGIHYPVNLPHHATDGPDMEPMEIPLSKLSYGQFWKFMEIEWPETPGAPPEPDNFETIGQIYSYIRCLVCAEALDDGDFQEHAGENQIQPEYYSANNVDTAYPSGHFDASQPPSGANSAAKNAGFLNREDSHAGTDELLVIDSKLKAQQAIATICDQGEGYNPEVIGKTDDPSAQEESHYYKFVSLQARLEKPEGYDEPTKGPKPPKSDVPPITAEEQGYFVVSVPDNPITRRDSAPGGGTAYASAVDQAVSDACNGLYQYMLILTETTFKVTGIQQKKLFNKGMHMSMIWILDKLVQKMREVPLGNGEFLAPTFENICLGTRGEAFANLNKLVKAAEDQIAAAGSDTYSGILYYIKLIPDLPDVSPHWDDC